MKLRISYILTAVMTFVIGIIVASHPPDNKPEKEFDRSESLQIFTFPAAELKILKPPPAATPAEPEPGSAPEKLTPVEIAGFIDNNPHAGLQDVWKRLKVRPNFSAWWPVDDPKSFMSVCEHCRTETYKYDLDDKPGSETIVRIANGLEECRYLIFKYDSAGDSWRFLGNVDHDFGRYEMPQHSFLVSGGQRYLAVRVQTQSGSGIAQYNNRLFTIYRGKLIELGEFPSDGHRTMDGYMLVREYTGKILSCNIQNGIARTEVEFNVNYSARDEESGTDFDLIKEKKSAVFIKRLNSPNTTLDPGRSTISQEELDTLYDLDAFDDRNFFKLYSKQLNTIKSQKGTKGYRWWKEFQEYSSWKNR